MASVRMMIAGLALSLGTAQAAQAADDFKPVFNGKNFSGLKFVLKDKSADPAKVWTVKEETIICTGKQDGYFHTEKSYGNYVLRFEVKYARPSDLMDDAKFGGNSGFLIHITDDHKVWPKCIEVQGMNKDMGNTFAIGGAKTEFKCDADAQKKAIKKVGEWNTVEITCKDGQITTKINGTQVCDGKSDLKSGPIGWQSEGAEIHFRKIEINEMK